MDFKFVNIATNATDVRFLDSYDILRIVAETYFERVQSLKHDATEFHWQQLTLHIVVVMLKNLISMGVMFVVELYSQLLEIEKRDNEHLLDFRSTKANVFLFDLFGEIEQRWRHEEWRLRFEELLPLLKLLAMFGCSKAMVVTLCCISNALVLERVSNLFLKIVTTCILEGHISTFRTDTRPNVMSTMSELQCATKTSMIISSTYILDLIKHIEHQFNTILKSSSDTHTKATMVLQLIK